MCKWYSFNFNIFWDRSQRPKTWIDIFIIDTIVREVVSHNKSKITFWRFHRRWANDAAGHEFTFDCYTDEETARVIETSIRSNIEFKKLQESGLLTNFDISRMDNIIDITKDTDWPEELKFSWLYYIKGCCETLLCLIEKIKGGKHIPTDIKKVEQFYNEINTDLIKIWQNYGDDSFFHNLSCVFGYEPLRIKPTLFASF